MARKFHVIEADGSEGPMLKKSVALLLVRRQFAILLAPFIIRLLPREHAAHSPRTPRAEYQHHVEPRLNRFTITSSPWLRYLHGYEQESQC